MFIFARVVNVTAHSVNAEQLKAAVHACMAHNVLSSACKLTMNVAQWNENYAPQRRMRFYDVHMYMHVKAMKMKVIILCFRAVIIHDCDEQ